MSSIRGNKPTLLPLKYIHFNFQPLFTNYAYPWDYILSLKFSKPV